MRHALTVLALCALAACNRNEVIGNDRAAESAEPVPPADIVPAGQAVAEADTAAIDPLTLRDSEIIRVTGARDFCGYAYTAAGHPVLAWDADAPETAAIKLNGKLVGLTRSGPLAYGAGPVEARLETEAGGDIPAGGRKVETTLMFRVGPDHEWGFGGYAACPWTQGD